MRYAYDQLLVTLGVIAAAAAVGIAIGLGAGLLVS
jgi:hypothetical protein